MVVCRFFQQGYCRFGQNCRFEHIYGSKFSYHANLPQQSAPPQQTTECTDENLVNQVQADMQLALHGGQWILSCYAPFKEKGMIPGLTDLSPEEARLFIYEAKNSNNLEQAVSYMNNLFREARQKYEQLLQPNVNIIKLLRSIYKGENVQTSFSNTGQSTFSGSNNAASSIFRSANQTTQPNSSQNIAASIFNQGQQSVFNTNTDQAKDLFSKANNTSIFAPNNGVDIFGPTNQNSLAKSIFSSAVQNPTNPANPSSIFSSANQSIFGPNQTGSPFDQVQNTSPFSQGQTTSPFVQTSTSSPFYQAQNNSPFSQVQNNSPFFQQSGNFSNPEIQKTGSPGSIFAQENSRLARESNPGIYSNIEELSEEDLEAFKSDKFELGFVPELPPPYQLCTNVF